MPQTPITQVVESVALTGRMHQAVVRDSDAAIRTCLNTVLYIDSDGDPFLDPLARVGRDLRNHKRYIYDPTIAIAQDAGFNNNDVFVCTGSQHYMRVFSPNLTSYDVFMVLSATAAQLAAADAFTLGVQYVFVTWDDIDGHFGTGFNIFGTAGAKGWSFNSDIGVAGANVNYTWTTYPQTRPVADVPFGIWLNYNDVTKTSKFYFNDGDTPVHVEADHPSGEPGGGDSQPWLYSFGPGGNTASWAGKGTGLFYHDESNPVFAVTDQRRIDIMAQARARFGY